MDAHARAQRRRVASIRQAMINIHQARRAFVKGIYVQFTAQFRHHIQETPIAAERAVAQSLPRDAHNVALFLRDQAPTPPIRAIAFQAIQPQISDIDMPPVRRRQYLMWMW